MDIERLKKRKRALGYTNEDVAKLTGVPLGTVQKIFAGVTKTPRRETIIALARVLDHDLANNLQSDGASLIRESLAAYDAHFGDSDKGKYGNKKQQGEYTLEDYYLIPDERRVELIDGVIYDMNGPSFEHQLTAGEIYHQMKNCAESHNMTCFPAIAPLDVQLDRDEKTMVQPDVIIICDKDKIISRCVYGAPEFVLEVLSKSTRKKDQIIKLKKYLEAGCKEYWIVDTKNEKVFVYDFEEENWPKVYSFDDNVPVGISEGLCEIDFTKVKREIEKARLFAGRDE